MSQIQSNVNTINYKNLKVKKINLANFPHQILIFMFNADENAVNYSHN